MKNYVVLDLRVVYKQTLDPNMRCHLIDIYTLVCLATHFDWTKTMVSWTFYDVSYLHSIRTFISSLRWCDRT
jgi:hypothetical protein